MADAYEERKKFVRWCLWTFLVALIVMYVLMLLMLPAEMLASKGLDIDSVREVANFWKKSVLNPGYLFGAYRRWWVQRLSNPARTTWATHLPLIPFVSFFLIMILGLLKNPYKNQINIFGEGRLASWADVKRMGLLDGKYIVLGRFKGHLLKMKETLSALVVAPPGTGKTVGVVVPTIFETPDCSLIVNDPKPELCFTTSGYRATQGPVFIINWGKEDDPEHGIYYPSWNPLSPECLPPVGSARDMYIDSMVPILVEEPKGGADPHWSKTGRNAMSGFLHFIASKCERARANDYFINRLQEKSFDAQDAELLKTYYMDMQDVNARIALDALNSGHLTLENYAPIGTWDGLPESWYGCEPCIAMILEWWSAVTARAAAELKRRADEGDSMAAMTADPIKDILDAAVAEIERYGYSHRAYTELVQVGNTPDKERGSVLSTAFSGIGIFKNAAVVARTRFSDFSFRDLRGMVEPGSNKVKPVTVYLSVDQVDAQALNVITGVFVELMSAFLIANPPNHVNAGEMVGPYPVMFVLDEFPQMPKLSAVKNGPAIGRGQKVSYLLIGQDLGQISGQYGQDDLETIITTTAAKVILAQNNEKTAERFVKMVGTKTIEVASRSKQQGMSAPSGSMFTENVSRSLQQSNVLSVADLTSLSPMKQYVLMQGFLSRPILADAPKWFLDSKMKRKASMKPAPNVPKWIVEHREALPGMDFVESGNNTEVAVSSSAIQGLANQTAPMDIAPMTAPMDMPETVPQQMPMEETRPPMTEQEFNAMAGNVPPPEPARMPTGTEPAYSSNPQSEWAEAEAEDYPDEAPGSKNP